MTINGTSIDAYIKLGGLKISRNDIDSAQAGRAQNGLMMRGRVASKTKIEIETIPLTQSQSQTLLQLIYPEYITVSYTDPRVGERSNVEFYSNNAAVSHQFVKGNETYWVISFPLVER